MAVSIKLNPLAMFDKYMEIGKKIDRQEFDRISGGIEKTEGQLGLKLREEILAPLGDGVCLFAALPAMPMAGPPDVTAVIQVKDPQQAAKSFDKLMQLAEMMLKGQGANNPMAPQLVKKESSGKQIYTLQQPGVVTPTWCLTDKELVISASPQGVQAYLSCPMAFKSLAQSPEIATRLSGDPAPMKLVYVDVRNIFDKLYPMLPMLAAILPSQGINVSLPPLPPPNAISPHLTPLVSSVRQTAAGIEITERMPLPGTSLALSAPMGAALLLPAIQAARAASIRQSTPVRCRIACAKANLIPASPQVSVPER